MVFVLGLREGKTVIELGLREKIVTVLGLRGMIVIVVRLGARW